MPDFVAFSGVELESGSCSAEGRVVAVDMAADVL